MGENFLKAPAAGYESCSFAAMLVAYTAYQESKEHEHWHRRGDTPQSVIQASPLWCEPSRPVKILTEMLCPLLEYGKGQVDGAAI